jgi:3-oxoacyl-[acyl-carrier protein] reductase
MDPKGKIALVTGASMGIGRATAVALARAGAMVAINYRSHPADAAETLAQVEAADGHGITVQADVADDAAVRAMVEQVAATLGGLDILVNNAAITFHVPFPDLEGLTDERWAQLFNINVRGTFACVRAAVPHLRRSGAGVVVNIGSVAGIRGSGSSIAYAASQGAVHTLTLALARTLAPEIRVNCVAPGFVDTAWHARGLGEAQAAQNKVASAERTPLGRVASPDDIAQMIMAVIMSDFVTGQIVVADGGASL